MRIRRRFPLLFVLAVALALVGCSRQLITATPPTPAPINPRTASIGEIVNIVLARASLAEQFAQVTPGYVLGAGGQVQTGDESRARLDFSDATIVRLAENSSFTMQNVTLTDDGLATRLKLEAGKIWVSLTGGTLEVETPVGVAAVRGSFAVFVYSAGDPADPNDDLLVLDCLEGSCSAQNDVVDERLGNLQRTVLTRTGRITFLLSDLDVQNFIQNNPEVADVIRATLTAAPPPTTTPAPTATDTPPAPPGLTPVTVIPPTSVTSIILTPVPTARPTSTTASGTTVQIIGLHTVLPGETIFCIGRGYGVLPTAIAQVNGTASLTPGQILRIPAVQWENIPAGPVCPPQFTSPFPGLTPTNTPAAAPSVTTVPPTDKPDPTDTSAAPVAPSKTPTSIPTSTPSKIPTVPPTFTPSSTPSKIPTVPPTFTPTNTPTVPPTFTPSNTPTFTPSKTPTITPTPDLVGPSISNLRPSPTALNGSTCDVTFQADVGDASGVLTATVVWTSFDFSGIQFSTGNVTLTGPSAGGTWSGTAFGINVPAFGHVNWTVSATDTLNNPSGPISGPTINETAGYGC